jgi:hypothetical protein
LTLLAGNFNVNASNMIAGLFANLFPRLPAVELVSVHVPKSAGTAFAHVLAQQYGPGFFMDYQRGPIHPDLLGQSMKTWRAAQKKKARQLPPETRAVHGHFWAGKYDSIFPRAKKIVWLRDPVRRLVSHYYYFKSKPSLPHPHPRHRQLHEKNLSLLEFARLPEMQNFITGRWLKDVPLDEFDFVGIQEFFVEDVAILAQTLGWRSVNVPTQNRTVHPEYEWEKLDPATLQEIESLNGVDVELYRQALALRGRTRQSGLACAPH